MRVTFAVSYKYDNPSIAGLTLDNPEAYVKIQIEMAINTAIAAHFFSELVDAGANQLMSIDALPQLAARTGGGGHGGASDDPLLGQLLGRRAVEKDCRTHLAESLATKGIGLARMNILEIIIEDKTLSQQVSEATSATVRLQADLRNMDLQRGIAEAKKNVLTQEAQAKAAALITSGQGDGEAALAKANGEAQAIRTLAAAEAEATRLKEGAALQVWSEMLKENSNLLPVLVARELASATSKAAAVGTLPWASPAGMFSNVFGDVASGVVSSAPMSRK